MLNKTVIWGDVNFCAGTNLLGITPYSYSITNKDNKPCLRVSFYLYEISGEAETITAPTFYINIKYETEEELN
jgi:hypothetical protein